MHGTATFSGSIPLIIRNYTLYETNGVTTITDLLDYLEFLGLDTDLDHLYDLLKEMEDAGWILMSGNLKSLVVLDEAEMEVPARKAS